MVYEKTKLFYLRGKNLKEFQRIIEYTLQTDLNIAVETVIPKKDLVIINFLNESKVDLFQEKAKIYVKLTAEFSDTIGNQFWIKLKKNIQKASSISKKEPGPFIILEFLIFIPLAILGITLLFSKQSTFEMIPIWSGLVPAVIAIMIVFSIFKLINFLSSFFSKKLFIYLTLAQIIVAFAFAFLSITLIQQNNTTFNINESILLIFIVYLSFAGITDLIVALIIGPFINMF